MSKKKRTKENKNLYFRDLTNTQQQRFIFDDELDDTFLLEFKKKKKRKSNSKNVNKASNSRTQKNKISIYLFVTIIILVGIIIFHYLTFNHNEVKIVTKEKEIKIADDNCLFLGDSITNRYDLEKYFPDKPVVNSGEEGNKADDILKNMKNRVYDYNPSKIFLLIGTNDLDDSNELTEDEVFNNIKEIIKNIQKNRPLADIYIESILPVNHDIENSPSKDKDYNKIININRKLKKYCEENNLTYINLYDELVDEDGHLPPKYTDDGLHLNENGYKKITTKIKKYFK